MVEASKAKELHVSLSCAKPHHRIAALPDSSICQGIPNKPIPQSALCITSGRVLQGVRDLYRTLRNAPERIVLYRTVTDWAVRLRQNSHSHSHPHLK